MNHLIKKHVFRKLNGFQFYFIDFTVNILEDFTVNILEDFLKKLQILKKYQEQRTATKEETSLGHLSLLKG